MNPSQWFTEQVPGAGSAFSLKIKQKVHEEPNLNFNTLKNL